MDKTYLLCALCGYLSGSILYSFLICKIFARVDIVEESHDGNPGTTNAMKHAGISFGIICLICDMAKGFIPVFITSRIFSQNEFLFALVMAAPVIGHAFPLFHKLKGGKAIATSFGVFLGLLPNYYLITLLVIIYLIFYLVFVVKPNERCSVFTFTLFTASSFVLYFMNMLPLSLLIGAILISSIVIFKNYNYDERVLKRKKLNNSN